MSAGPQYDFAGRFQYGDIAGVSQVRYTTSWGARPGVCMFEVPGDRLGLIPAYGDMYWSDGNNSHKIPDCRTRLIDNPDASNTALRVEVEDFRWKWQYGEISGAYNVRQAGKILERTARTPEQLFKLIFKKLDVDKYNLRELPKDIYPEIKWDITQPAAALEQLASDLGFVICPQPDGSVDIRKQVKGSSLPRIRGADITGSIELVAGPASVQVDVAPTVWEVSLAIGEPLGEDVDGTIKPIDQLSYKPKNGWSKENPEQFPGVDKKYRKLAQKSVWRMYRIKWPEKLPSLGGEKPKDQLKIEAAHQVLLQATRLTRQQIQTADTKREGDAGKANKKDPVSSESIANRKPAIAYGRFYGRQDIKAINVPVVAHNFDDEDGNGKKLIYPAGFSIDNQRTLVVFGDACFLWSREKGYYPAEVFVRCVMSVADKETGAEWRQTFSQKTGLDNGTQPEHFPKPDLRREIIMEPSATNDKIKEDNKDALTKDANYYLKAMGDRYDPKTPEIGEYDGFLDLPLDGSIQQVTWQIDAAGFSTTTASRGCEHSLVVPTVEERRQAILFRDYTERQKGIADQKARDADKKQER